VVLEKRLATDLRGSTRVRIRHRVAIAKASSRYRLRTGLNLRRPELAFPMASPGAVMPVTARVAEAS
jgi:hypothetical protein